MKKPLFPLALLLCASFGIRAQEGVAVNQKAELPVFKTDGKAPKSSNTTAETYFTIQTVGFNSKAADIWPRPYGNNIVISSNRKGKKGTTKFFSLYLVAKDAKAPKKLKGNLYSNLNDASPVFTADGHTVYFTRNHRSPIFFRGDKDQLTKMALYKSTKKRKKWGPPELLPFSDTSYSTAHPVINQAGDQLYFVSDMPGGFGGTDIYRVAILEDGSYGTPVNLGKEINTAADETSPYLFNDKKLLFASKGHNGFGGYDLFAVDLDHKKEVINLGPQINTEADEFGVMTNGEDGGYFSSNRDNGNYDIYAFSVANSLMQLFQTKENFIAAVDQKQTIATTLKQKAQQWSTAAQQQDSQPTKYKTAAKTTIKTAKLPKAGDNLIAYLAIDPVHFGFDSAAINAASKEVLIKVANYLKQSPVKSIEIIGHTDRIGDSDYNKALSLKRANNVKIFLIEQGVKQGITTAGMGDSKPLENCENCIKENRRAAIKMKN